jgi:hypothetical protein
MTLLRTILAAALLAAIPATAIAKDGDVRKRGTCTKSSTSKIKLGEEDGQGRPSSRSTRTATVCAGR